ncbi:hypothetical protein CFOL_v3_04617, partial [Cephalotus follicularis]
HRNDQNKKAAHTQLALTLGGKHPIDTLTLYACYTPRSTQVRSTPSVKISLTLQKPTLYTYHHHAVHKDLIEVKYLNRSTSTAAGRQAGFLFRFFGYHAFNPVHAGSTPSIQYHANTPPPYLSTHTPSISLATHTTQSIDLSAHTHAVLGSLYAHTNDFFVHAMVGFGFPITIRLCHKLPLSMSQKRQS